jgi:ribosomal 50S subunit-associated protein YjgA (DUF615 family)
MSTETIKQRLQEARIESEEHEARLKELRGQIDKLIVQGDKAGIPKLTLSKLAGLTRQTVYTVLLKNQARA